MLVFRGTNGKNLQPRIFYLERFSFRFDGKIKNFIKDNGPAPAITIARNTGVSKQAIECYFRDDVTISPKDGDFIQNRVTKTERRLSKDIEGKWHSSIWKR